MFIIDIQEGYFILDIRIVLFDLCVQMCMSVYEYVCVCVYVMCVHEIYVYACSEAMVEYPYEDMRLKLCIFFISCPIILGMVPPTQAWILLVLVD